MTVLYSSRQATVKDLPGWKPTEEASPARADISSLPGFANFHTANPRHIFGTVVRDLYRYVTDLDLLVCGPWGGLAEEYRRMLQHVNDNGLKMNGIYAESFLHIDFDEPANQITEIQIGLS